MASEDERKRKEGLISKNFIVERCIGQGTFGFVHRVKLKKDNFNGDGKESVKKEFALKSFIRFMKPNSIAKEIQILRKLGGRENIIEYLASWRTRDDVFLLLEYFEHEPFNLTVAEANLAEIQDYIKNLLIALRFLHRNGYVHRDVKPMNFLCNRKKRRYRLIDFGLSESLSDTTTGSRRSSSVYVKENRKRKFAELQGTVSSSPGNATLKRSKTEPNPSAIMFPLDKNADRKQKHVDFSTKKTSVPVELQLPLKRSRSPNKRPRRSLITCSCLYQGKTCRECRGRKECDFLHAGTSGYKAPEALLGSHNYGTSVDMWAVGMILMSLISRKNPFLRPDSKNGTDCTALTEIAILCGSKKLEKAAEKAGQVWISDPEFPGLDLKLLAMIYRAGNYEINGRSEFMELECEICRKYVKCAVKGIRCLCAGKAEVDENVAFSNDVSEIKKDRMLDLLIRLLEPEFNRRIDAETALKEFFQ